MNIKNKSIKTGKPNSNNIWRAEWQNILSVVSFLITLKIRKKIRKQCVFQCFQCCLTVC